MSTTRYLENNGNPALVDKNRHKILSCSLLSLTCMYFVLNPIYQTYTIGKEGQYEEQYRRPRGKTGRVHIRARQHRSRYRGGIRSQQIHRTQGYNLCPA